MDLLKHKSLYMEIEKSIGYHFQNPSLLIQALTHKSFANENIKSNYPNNERLEFLGDAVLNLIIAHLLINKFPFAPEGELSRFRSTLVNKKGLSTVARSIDLGKFLLLGKGEEHTGGREKDSILSGAYEALIGAIYLDSCFNTVFKTVEKHFLNLINSLKSPLLKHDYKTELQEISLALYSSLPEYILTGESGPCHNKLFEITILINGKILAKGLGKSKKLAEQKAAKEALNSLKEEKTI